MAADPRLVNKNQAPVNIVDYGNGVYYFEATEAVFGNALSKFISEHPKLQVITMAPNDTGGHGFTLGYFVVTTVSHEPGD